MRFIASPTSARSDIVLVDINDSTLNATEPVFGRWPWPRAVHASIIDYLTRTHARVIGFDILFLEPDSRGAFAIGGTTMSGSASDAALAASIARAGNVVLLADATYEGLESGADAAQLLPPSLPGKRGAASVTRTSSLRAANDVRGSRRRRRTQRARAVRERSRHRAASSHSSSSRMVCLLSLGLAAALLATGKRASTSRATARA